VPTDSEAAKPATTQTATCEDNALATANAVNASDDAENGQVPEGNSATATRRIGLRRALPGSPIGRRRGGRRRERRATKPPSCDAHERAGQADAESVEAEASAPSDTTQDFGTAEAVITDGTDDGRQPDGLTSARPKRRIDWPHLLAYGVLPGAALALTVAAGFLKWQDSLARVSQTARIESVAAAKDSTIALLSYQSDTVEKDLGAARGRLTGKFQDSYTQLVNDVVIPGAKKQHVSATAKVPAAASVSSTPNHAVVLLFVDQTAIVDKDPPTDTATSVRVTMDKVAGRWLLSAFEPV